MRWSSVTGALVLLVTALSGTAAGPASVPAAEEGLGIRIPADLFVQDLTAPGDHGAIEITGCVADSPLLALDVDVSYAVPGGGLEGDPLDGAPLSLGDDGVPQLAVSTVSAWLSSEPRAGGGLIVVDAFCEETGDAASDFIRSLPFSVELPKGVTVTSLAAGGDPGVVTIARCRLPVEVNLSYRYDVAPGEQATLPIALTMLEVDADRAAELPLDPVASWLQEEQPAPGGSVAIAASCASPHGTATATIVSQPDLGSPTAPPPSPTTPSPASPMPQASTPDAPDAALPDHAVERPALAATGAVLPIVAVIVAVALIVLGAAFFVVRSLTRRDRP